MSRFLEALHSRRVLLMDGAMGTEIQRAGIADGECYELWNLTHPNQVRAIHRAYRFAGAECFLTNTFQSNPPALRKHGLEDKLEAINQSAIDLARSAWPGQFVLGSIGPIEGADATWDVLDPVVRSLAGVDALLLETWSDPSVAAIAQRARDSHGLPVLLSFTFERSAGPGRPPHLHGSRLSPEKVAERVYLSGIAALGVNCGRDISMPDVSEVIRRYRRVTDLPLFARPNAGTPTRTDGGWVYPLTPSAMAARLTELLDAGVRMVGGCCGTTPAHIAALRPVVREWNRSKGTS